MPLIGTLTGTLNRTWSPRDTNAQGQASDVGVHLADACRSDSSFVFYFMTKYRQALITVLEGFGANCFRIS